MAIQLIDYTDNLKTGTDKLNNAILAFNQTLTGDSSLEAAAARVDADGNTFLNLKDRLDTKETSTNVQLLQKANTSDLQQISLAYKESYATLSALQSAYPNGNAYNHAVLADGLIYTYNNGWVSTGIQANGTGIADSSISARKLSFSNIKTQYLLTSNRNSGKGYYHGATTMSATSDFTNVTAFPPIRILAGITYAYAHIYGYFGAIKYDDNTVVNITTLVTDNLSGSITPTQNGYIYISVLTSRISTAMFVSDVNVPDIYVEGDYAQKLNNIYGLPIESTDYFKKLYQYLIASSATSGYYYNRGLTSTAASASASIFAPIRIYKDVIYTYSKLYAYFCTVVYDTGVKISLSDNASDTVSGTFSPTSNGYIYITCLSSNVGKAQFVNNNKIFDQYSEGYVGASMPQLMIENDVKNMKLSGFGNIIITVKSDGTGDYTSVVDAVNFANNLNTGCDIYIYDGTYDILAELGGQTFIDSIAHSGTFAERQGLRLDRDNINLIGIGRVVLSYQLPDTVTYVQSQCTSTINLYKSNRIENIEFVAKNCRYACHDETDGGNPMIKRYVKNCRFTHLGNVSGLWEYPTVYGGGGGGSSQYDFINCQFITNAYMQAWSFHTNSNQNPSHYNVDGCVGIVNSATGNSFNCTYNGTGQIGKTIFNIKNCTGNGVVRKAAEQAGSFDHIDVYTNGYNQITV